MRGQRLVLRVLGPRVLAVTGLILALIAGIFLAESFTGHMNFVLRYGGRAQDLALVLLLGMPEIIDLALPLAILVGVHIAVADTRDEGAWVVSASAGIAPWQITGFVGLFGVLGFGLSLLASGWLVPVSTYAQRMALAELQVSYTLKRITGPLDPGEVLQVQGHSFVVRDNQGRAELLILTRNADGSFTFARVDDWQVAAAPSDTQQDRYELRLGPMQVRTADPTGEVWTRSLNLGGATFSFGIDDVLPDINRDRGIAERTLGALLPRFDETAPPPELQGRLAELLARALLAPAAAILALATTLLGGPAGGRLAGLPLALGIMLGADLGLRPLLVTAAVEAGMLGAAVPLLAALVLLPPLVILILAGERLIRQRRGEA